MGIFGIVNESEEKKKGLMYTIKKLCKIVSIAIVKGSPLHFHFSLSLTT